MDHALSIFFTSNLSTFHFRPDGVVVFVVVVVPDGAVVNIDTQPVGCPGNERVREGLS